VRFILFGYRGTGKSSIATLVAQRLGLDVIGMDGEIVRRAGKAVPEIVAERGWPGFRDLEESVCRDAAASDGVVIDCGGGVVERGRNIEVLAAAGAVFWLKARPDTIVARIGGDTQRPSLTGTKSFTDEVVEVLARREPLYAQVARFAIDTDDLTPEQVADQIVTELAGSGFGLRQRPRTME
jgi:shikimate kinase